MMQTMRHALRVAATAHVAPHSAPPALPVPRAQVPHVRHVLVRGLAMVRVKRRAVTVRAAVVPQRVMPLRAQAPAVWFAPARAQIAQVKPIAPVALPFLTSNLPANRLVRPACKIRHHEYSI